MENNPIVTITMEDGGKIVAELYPDVAPQSVYNFISLIKKGFTTASSSTAAFTAS